MLRRAGAETSRPIGRFGGGARRSVRAPRRRAEPSGGVRRRRADSPRPGRQVPERDGAPRGRPAERPLPLRVPGQRRAARAERVGPSAGGDGRLRSVATRRALPPFPPPPGPPFPVAAGGAPRRASLLRPRRGMARRALPPLP